KVLTISIAAYNIERFLRDSLERLLCIRNTDKLEILVISDGSTDRTERIAEEYVGRYPDVVRLLCKENAGWGSTVNKAIQIAEGKYLKLLDGDDFYLPENLEEFIDFLDKCEADAVISPYLVFRDRDGKILAPGTERGEFSIRGMFGPEKIGRLFSVHELCVRTELLREGGVRIHEHCFYTDVEYVAKAVCLVRTLQAFPRTIYLYRTGVRGQSTSREGFILHRDEHFLVIRVLNRLRGKYDPSSCLYRLLTERLGRMIRKRYQSLLSLRPGRAAFRELTAFDRWTYKNCPDIHGEPTRAMKAVRASNYRTYPLIAKLVRIKMEVFREKSGHLRRVWYG
ncbi:MAG: glycosyltransferase family 2 protein, partial [Lachnospiraceae bacterium]